MREKAAASEPTNSQNKKQQTGENRKPEAIPVDGLTSYSTDEFRFHLLEIMTKTYWSDISHGDWSNPILFFSYLDKQVEIVYQLKDNPLLLKNQFESINPSLPPDSPDDATSRIRGNLPVLRQQVFLINALYIIIKKRFRKDQSLRLALSALHDLLHKKIVETLKNFGTTTDNPGWYEIANRVEACADLKSKADAVYDFLSATMKKNNIKTHADRRSTTLFMREQLESLYDVISQNNNNTNATAFGDNRKLENFCSNLYYEYHRLMTLNSLEGLEQKD